MLHPETSVEAPIAQTTSPPEKKSSDPRAGAFWMIMSAVGVTLMMLSVRVLSADLPSQMIVCLRSLFGVSVLLPLLINGRLFRLRMASPRLHLLRGLCAVAALNLGFFAMSVLPLATATILFFLAPIFATAGAAVFLGEKVGIWRWGAVVAATIGALIVVRPGVAPFDLGTAAAIVSTVFFASQLILSNDEPGRRRSEHNLRHDHPGRRHRFGPPRPARLVDAGRSRRLDDPCGSRGRLVAAHVFGHPRLCRGRCRIPGALVISASCLYRDRRLDRVRRGSGSVRRAGQNHHHRVDFVDCST